jgi:predicted DCC family thiol-disulfide oxidoreductase YuxK
MWGRVFLVAVVLLAAWSAVTWRDQPDFKPFQGGPEPKKSGHRRRGTTEIGHPLFLFDGVCALCNAAVQFVIARDEGSVVHFGALQSDPAVERLKRAGRADLAPCAEIKEPEPCDKKTKAQSNAANEREWTPSTMVLIDTDGVVYTHSTAALRLAAHMDFPWNNLRYLLAVPQPIRDLGYIAMSKARWMFGVIEEGGECLADDASMNHRFIDREDHEDLGCLA